MPAEKGVMVLFNEPKKAELKSAWPDKVEVHASHPSKIVKGGAGTFVAGSQRQEKGGRASPPASNQSNHYFTQEQAAAVLSQ